MFAESSGTLFDMSVAQEQAAAHGPNVVEVTDQTFGELVLQESMRRPVVVDFWAEWCQPCRMIGPVLERLAAEYQGAFLLAKLDVDANPQAASAFRIQSIPAVKAFRDGRLVDEFMGAIPETAIREFLRAQVPSTADVLAAEGENLLAAGRIAEAEVKFDEALVSEPGHRLASVGVAQVAAARGDVDTARRLLEPLRPDPAAERLLAALQIAEWGSGDGSGGRLAEAEAAAAQGRFADALEGLLSLVREGGEERDAAREAMVKIFSVLGDEDPLTGQYRPKLAAALF